MKIAIISSGFFPVVDGVTVTLINRIYRLSKDGHQVLLLCPDYSSLEKIYPNWRKYTGNILPGVKVINLPSNSLMGLNFERNVTKQSYQIVLEKLHEFQPDIIHVDEPERLFVGFLKTPGVDFAKKNHLPCISFFHTNFLEYGKDYFSTPAWLDIILKWIFQLPLAWIYNQYDATLVSSSITAQKLSRMGIKNVVRGSFLGIDLAQFNRDLRREQFFEDRYNISDIAQKVKLVFLGRLTPDKGWKFTINAWFEMANKVDFKNIAVIIAGDGSMRDEIAKQLGKLTPNLYFLGRIPHEDVPALLVNCDIHITTSEKETKGLTILEAFAAGIPAIAPRAGGISDSIQDGWNGFLYEPQNCDDFTKKLKQLIDDPNLRKIMGARGRDYIVEYSWDNAVKNLLQIWEEKIAARQQNNS
ncbi:glycosyl transferase family 1 [Hydrococcus rivularis NIES-593]|uniref:Glycosyl transferase family 1 n=1 Tax=Hydrococcus rivularis NIES-593 TaxID=1921803 RepID=A0A1U7HRD2_9CYAN|nr:glycosyltransferase [Hydrococcus rivularis]OKH26160.1 glycosyl transferase family 1 [Hydrococcus rivularis NIES-593]